MKFLRDYWQDLGIVVAFFVCIGLLVNGSLMPEIEIILWLSFVAILVHQFEEYRWPGYFGGLFNGVIFRSEHPERYPLNTQSAMIINLGIAYLFYLLPVFVPHLIWLGLAPVFMGFFQFIWHGIFANIKAKTIYYPGLGAVCCFIFRSAAGISIISLVTIWQVRGIGFWARFILLSPRISSSSRGICG